MIIPPASVLASWPTPNYVNPVTRGPGGKIIAVALTTLATLILSIRVYTRSRIVRNFGLDDALILAAFLPSLAFTVCGIYAEYNLGWDRHIWDVQLSALTRSSQMSLVIFCLFDLSTSLVKLSTLAMLWRLVRATKSPMRIVTLVAAGGVVGSGLLFIFITVFQCSPMWQYWTLSAEPQACIDESVHLLVAGLINTITDFAVVILPIKTVAGLCLPRKQYFVLIVLFCAGFCACIAGCVRTYYTYVFTESYDRTWFGWNVWTSSAIELYLGVICASVPSCKQFFTTYLPGVIDYTRRSGKYAISKGDNRKSTRLSVTVKTLVETTYQSRSNSNLINNQRPSGSAGHELHELDEHDEAITEPQRAKMRPLSWPIDRPPSYVDEELGLEKVSTKQSSECSARLCGPSLCYDDRVNGGQLKY